MKNKTSLEELMDFMEQRQYFIGNDLFAKYHELLKKENEKQLTIPDVVFNEAKTIDKQTQRNLIEQIMKADEELGLYSEAELVCIFESNKPTCSCELNHCLKKGY